MKRQLDAQILSEWIAKKGDRSMGDLIHKSGLSWITIFRMAKGEYKATPQKRTIRDLCATTGLHEDVLFPKCKEEEAS